MSRLRATAAAVLVFLLFLPIPAAEAARLPSTAVPAHYDLEFVVHLAKARFDGTETIRVQIAEPASRIVLHAVDLEIHEATIDQGGTSERAVVTFDEAEQTATLAVGRTLAAGPAEIHLRFTGVLNDKLRGFYLSRTRNRLYAVTQFESTDARRAFPCFDEPALKATFALTLTIDRGDTAISNGAVLSDKPGPARTQHTLRFATTPKMSTYLVAMAVGRFRCLDASEEGVPIRICATPDKAPLGRIALESARQILRYYNGYYAVKYPFGKLDIVAVPDFAAGAMENTAAIFYRESDLLADARSASLDTRKNIASVLAHEMAHEWFGDLVTMRWWDDLWLNEGFATWMAPHPLAVWKPEWNIPVEEALETEAALGVDSLTPTRAIHAEVETPAQIEAAFDTIAYEKSAAVLRMIESYVGAETFRKGVNTYLQAHAYGNATSADFWNALASVSGKPVDRILATFVNQPGAPLVSASSACAGAKTTLALSQERFFLDASLLARGSTERWQTPVCAKTPEGRISCDVLSERSATMSADTTKCDPWIFANAGARGYYRTAYDRATLRAMAPHVEQALTAPERLSLVSDEWALVHVGRHDVGDYLALAAGYASERVAGVLGRITTRLDFLDEYVSTDQTRPVLRAFVRSLWRPLLDEIGFSAAPTDDDARRSLRAVLILALGTTADDEKIVADARAAAARALGGAGALDPTVASAVLSVAAAHGDERLFEQLRKAADHAVSPEEHYRYLHALAAFRDPAIIDRALADALSPELRSQDTSIYLGRFLGNPVARPRTWSFIKEHWAELEPKVTIAEGDAGLAHALGAFCDAASRDDIKAFFAAHPLPSAGRALAQAMEQIDNCIAFREAQAPALADWLAHRESAKSVR